MNQRAPKPHLNWVGNCPNALDLSVYPCHPHRGEYLLFLGRMSPDKGAHRAVAVAMQMELPLKIAQGKCREVEKQYFDEFVAPHLTREPDRVPRRGQPRPEGGAAPERARDAVPDRVGGAVRPGDDRVDGVAPRSSRRAAVRCPR